MTIDLDKILDNAVEDNEKPTPVKPTAVKTPTPSGASKYFAPKLGLLTMVLANDVLEGYSPLAQGIDGRVWRYVDGLHDRDGGRSGVWVPAPNEIRDRVVWMLRDRYRPNHTTAVQHTITSVIPEITSEPIEQFVNVRNGLLDWRTGELTPHTPTVPSTVQLDVEWKPDAVCPAFDAWLAEVVPPDCIPLVWELIGYLCYSGNPLHTAVMLVGSGRNGKGTFLRTVTTMLGARNVTAVSLHDLVNTRFSTANLFGKIANIAGDIDAGYLENTATFKAITGGDLVSAEHKGRDRFDFTPWAVPLFSANRIPASADTTAGYLSRWVIVPFPNSFEGREDRTLDARLQAPDELAGILVKALATLPGLLRRGHFALADSALAARDQFERDVDQVRAWLHECTAADGNEWISRTVLYSAYKMWCLRDGGKPVRASEFYRRLESTGILPGFDQSGRRGFRGLRIVDSGALGAEPASCR